MAKKEGTTATLVAKKSRHRDLLVKVEIIAKLAGRHRNTILNWARDGVIHSSHAGATGSSYRFHIPTVARQIRIPDETIEAYFADKLGF